jgi:hypothetical protein
MPVFTEPSRDFDYVSSLGSSLTIAQYSSAGVLLTPGVTFDVNDWTIDETLFNENTTHSGSNGATLRTRTGQDWTFAAVLSFPARLVGTALAAQFVQQLLGSSRSVAVSFDIGKQEFWTTQIPVEDVRQYRADKVLLSRVQTRVAILPTPRVIGLNVAGESNSLLELFLDGVRQVPNAYT